MESERGEVKGACFVCSLGDSGRGAAGGSRGEQGALGAIYDWRLFPLGMFDVGLKNG